MARYLDPCSLSRLSRTCQAFRELFGGHILLAYLLEHSIPMLKEVLVQKGCNRFGFVLKNQYSFDEQKGVTPEHLYGRDSSIYASFARAFSGYRVYTRECYVKASYSDSKNFSNPSVYQALKRDCCSDIKKFNSSDSEERKWPRHWSLPDVVPVPDIWASLVPWGWTSMTPLIDLEEDISLLPFFHSLWFNTGESLLDVALSVEADATVSCWANDCYNRESWYHAIVLFVDLLDEPAPPADDGVLTRDLFTTNPFEFSSLEKRRWYACFGYEDFSVWDSEEKDNMERKERKRARDLIRNRKKG